MDFFTNANFNSDSYDKCFICELFFKQYDLDLHFTTFHDTRDCSIKNETGKMIPANELQMVT